MKNKTISILFFSIIILSTSVFAQTNISTTSFENDTGTLDAPLQEENINAFKHGQPAMCIDYHKFNSIDINLTQDYSVYAAGDSVYLQGSIKNNNTYPVIGMDIKARVVKKVTESKKTESEIIILQDLDIVSKINLDTGAEYKVKYSYLLPLNAPSGEYEIYFYAVEQDRYNLAGIPSTNNIAGAKISFDVNGKNPDHVYLDQSKVTIGDVSYNDTSLIIESNKEKTIPVSIALHNPSQKSKEMTVTYNLYSWDNTNPKNLIVTKTENVTVSPQTDKILNYTVNDVNVPVYYLSIEAKLANPTKDESVYKESSISNILFTVDGAALPKLVFSGIDSYALKKGKESSLVTCFNNSIESQNKYTKIETILKDMTGKVITQTMFEGYVFSNFDAIVQKFKPNKDLSDFVVITTVYDEKNNIIDQVEKIYNCNNIDPSKCPAPRDSLFIIYLIIIIIIASIIGLTITLFKKK